jgi:hypothetical protein
LSSKGVMLIGSGFIVKGDFFENMTKEEKNLYKKVVKPYRNGRDIAQKCRDALVIDFNGLSEEQARKTYPIAYQQVLEYVKPERDQNKEKSRRENWWLFGRNNTELRAALNGLEQYITTIETSKHRFFVSIDGSILPDNKLVNFGLNSSFHLGVLSSRLHVIWSFKTGSRLGVGNDPVYVKTTCFESFPFPDIHCDENMNIKKLAIEIDEHRKKIKTFFPMLAITSIYNVLEKIREERFLTDKEKDISKVAQVPILKKLYDDLDRAVFAAYGWEDLMETLIGLPGATTPLPDKSERQAEAEEELLSRLVQLNQQRSAEEVQGHIRWLRPDFQSPDAAQGDIGLANNVVQSRPNRKSIINKIAWPKEIRDQINTLLDLLTTPTSNENLAEKFRRNPIKHVNAVLDALETLGKAQQENGVWSLT